jgi:hypothetical protein
MGKLLLAPMGPLQQHRMLALTVLRGRKIVLHYLWRPQKPPLLILLAYPDQARNDRESLMRTMVKTDLTRVREWTLHVHLEHSTGSYFLSGALSVDLRRVWGSRLRHRQLKLHPRDIF